MIINYNRLKVVEYGVNIDDLIFIIRSAYAGEKAGVVFEGDKRFNIVGRLNKQNRHDLNLNALFILTASGVNIRISELATVQFVEGPMQITKINAVIQVLLRLEQIALAGITTAKPEKRVLSGYGYANGRLELPPQNMVSVHAATGGFVGQVNFLPGEVVKKGQMLCILEKPGYAQKQQQFLESKAQLNFLQK